MILMFTRKTSYGVPFLILHQANIALGSFITGINTFAMNTKRHPIHYTGWCRP
jgi:hypothetical protein